MDRVQTIPSRKYSTNYNTFGGVQYKLQYSQRGIVQTNTVGGTVEPTIQSREDSSNINTLGGIQYKLQYSKSIVKATIYLEGYSTNYNIVGVGGIVKNTKLAEGYIKNYNTVEGI